ncbi:MAG: tyrosine-protein kinase Etk/Wzc, partial [Saprospiraceae bacterium]
MNIFKEFRLFILPVFKGLPLIVTIMVLGYLAASNALQYMIPEYEVGAKIKLDNRSHGDKNFELFEEKTSAAQGSNFLTEVEVFKTKTLQRKAIQKLDFDVSYYRVSDTRNIELYKETPFQVDYKILDTLGYDKDIYLKYAGNGKFRFYKDFEYTDYTHSLRINKAYTDSTTISYRIRRNEKFLKKNPQTLQIGDAFIFRVNNIETLVKAIDKSNFFCSPVDKEVFIVKIHYKHVHPQKAADFLNSLLDTYIETNGERKAAKTSKILQFIDTELDSLGDEMKVASLRLSKYRKNNNIINADQETEAILRQLNQFDMSKLNLDLKEIELKNV